MRILDSHQEPGRHEIERAAARLNAWFAAHKERIPIWLDIGSLRPVRHVPVFQPVQTTALAGWKVEDLNRLFRVARDQTRRAGNEVLVPIELLVVDKSPKGAYLNVRKLLTAALDVFAARHLLGRFNPRLRWFWLHYPPLLREIESYVDEIRLRVDAATPIPGGRKRVFEEFKVPLENGRQTALGESCLFLLELAKPQGAAVHWRFSVTQDGEVIVPSQPLRVRPIYHGDRLVAVIRRIAQQTVTLSVLTSEGGQ